MSQSYGAHLDSKCAVCGNLVEITEGAILFDTKWYHQKCWNSGDKNG